MGVRIKILFSHENRKSKDKKLKIIEKQTCKINIKIYFKHNFNYLPCELFMNVYVTSMLNVTFSLIKKI